jgi:hypothetical protein
MNCILKNRDEVIEKYLGKLMNEQEAEAFEKHMFDCDECFNDVLIRQHVSELVKTEGRELFTSFSSDRSKSTESKTEIVFERYNPKYWLIVAAAAAIIFIGGYLITQTIWKNNPGQKGIVHILSEKINKPVPVIKEKEKVSEKTGLNSKNTKSKSNADNIKNDNQLLAQNFTESPNFENLIAQHFRSDFATEISSPALNSIFSNGKINFEWKTGAKESIILKIYNNREHLLYSAKTDRNQLKVNLNAEPGLYYWKLETEDNLLYVGRFLIK